MKIYFLFFLVINSLLAAYIPLTGQNFDLKSPNGRVRLAVTAGEEIRFSVFVGETQVLLPSPVSLKLMGAGSFSSPLRLKSSKTRTVRDTILPVIPLKRSRIPDSCNELTMEFKEPFSLVFRTYDDGVAYRWQTSFKHEITVENERASFVFPGDPLVWLPEIQQRDYADIFHTSFEEPYKQLKISEMSATSISYPPVLVELSNGVKAVVLESDLEDYPGMFISKGKERGALDAVFAGYPLETFVTEGEFPQEIVRSRQPFIAKTDGRRNFPWRVVALSEKDGQLIENDLAFRLARPAPGDWSWVKPGISTEEWICGSNLYGVDFRAGLNTATYCHYIDFAAEAGLDFVMLDAGWSHYRDLFSITPGMDMDSIAAYARSKGVALVLWTLSMTLDQQLEAALTQFEKWGVRCIMTDFMDRNDQPTVNFYHRIAEACTSHRIMIMFHGAFPSCGFERTFPNSITREGAIGSEYNIWSEKASPDHDLTLPFTRMLSGAMDYEPGFLDNATKDQFRPIGMKVMSQGTRTHQLAMFVCYDSPLQMFSGNPSDGYREMEFMQFLGKIPTVWDETRALEAKLGDYLVVARRSGGDWWIGGMTDWEARTFEIPLGFLGEGVFNVEICEDGLNADRNARDYALKTGRLSAEGKLTVKMAPGGGFVARFFR